MTKLLLVFSLLLPTLALAAPASDYQPYVPPEGGEVPAPLFVVLAYSAIWLVLLVFVASVWLRQRHVELELKELQRQLGAREVRGGGGQ
jgi:CcmD family protein